MFNYKVILVSAIFVSAIAEPPSSYGPPGYTSNFNKVTTTFTGGSGTGTGTGGGSTIFTGGSSGTTFTGGSSGSTFTGGSTFSGGEGGAPEPYSYAYEVKDGSTGNDYSSQANSDGKRVTGEYRVLLPDGRRQIVKYTADDGGYNANVQYEGQARYPVTPVKPAGTIITTGGTVISSSSTGGSSGTGTIIAGGSSGSSTFGGYRY